MKRLTNPLVYAVIILGIFTQCDNVPSNPADLDAPIPPELIIPENNSTVKSLQAELVWEKIEDANSYQLWLSATDDFETLALDTTISEISIITPPLAPQTTYSWKVMPIKKDKNGPWSKRWKFTTVSKDTSAATAVRLISPTDNATEFLTDLEFKWEQFSEGSEYLFQITEDSTFTLVIDEEKVNGSSYSPEGLLHQKKYFWRVKISDDTTGKTWSEVWSVSTKQDDTNSEPEATTPVTLLSPANNLDKASIDMEFSWEPITGIRDYSYQLSDNSSFSSVITEDQVSGTTYRPANLIHQKRYYWRVKVAADDNGKTWSDIRSFTTGHPDDEPVNPTTVTLLSPADNAYDLSVDPRFEWSEVSGASAYEFQLSTNSSFSVLDAESVEYETTYQAGNLDYQTQYYWRVKVSGTDYEWSATRSFMTESEPVTTTPPPSGSFVQVHNSNFVLDGKVMRFAGTNAYYLPNYEKLNPAVVDRALDLFQETEITVIRMWGFYDGYDCGYSKNDANENVIQTAPGVYSEEALKDLDNVIAKGKERGIGFVIPFINFWDELGGVCQYNTWAGASDPSVNMEFFLTNNDTQKWYKDYIKMLLNRVNTVTGIAYKNEPAIVAWQIMNEGRNPGASATILRDWYQEIAQYIKSIDSNHLISTGEEGFDEATPSEYSVAEYSNTYTLRANIGSSYVMNTAIPEIDFGNAHWYPSEYGFGIDMDEDLLRAQRAWLSDHKQIAENSGKPFMIGEFGFPGWADERVSTMYNAFYEHAESIGMDGVQLWQLAADGTKCWEFGGNICYPAGRADTDLYTAFKNHVNRLRNVK